MTTHEELLQSSVNLVAMLEKMYKTDIKNTNDYLEIRNQWYNMGKPVNVALIASHGVKRATKNKPARWNPLGRWDRKKNPIKWDDLLED